MNLQMNMGLKLAPGLMIQKTLYQVSFSGLLQPSIYFHEAPKIKVPFTEGGVTNGTCTVTPSWSKCKLTSPK